MDRPGVRQVPEGSVEQGKMEKTGCKIICGAPTTLAVTGLMMMMTMADRITLFGISYAAVVGQRVFGTRPGVPQLSHRLRKLDRYVISCFFWFFF